MPQIISISELKNHQKYCFGSKMTLSILMEYITPWKIMRISCNHKIK